MVLLHILYFTFCLWNVMHSSLLSSYPGLICTWIMTQNVAFSFFLSKVISSMGLCGQLSSQLYLSIQDQYVISLIPLGRNSGWNSSTDVSSSAKIATFLDLRQIEVLKVYVACFFKFLQLLALLIVNPVYIILLLFILVLFVQIQHSHCNIVYKVKVKR